MIHLLRILPLSLVLMATSAVSAAEYQIIDLGPLDGGVGSNAYGINDKGEVVGVSYADMNGNIANSLPIRWGTNGVAQKLWEGDGWLQFGGGRPQAINNVGEIVGQAQNSPYTGTPLPTPGVPDGVAFYWDATGGQKDLGTLGGNNSIARALNDSHQVAGTAQNTNGDARAFVWSVTGGMQDLGTLGGIFSFGNAINESGQVVGYAADANGNERAFLWDTANGMRGLGTLGGDAAYSRALAINDLGIVVGTSRSLSVGGAFIWDSALGMKSLNATPGIQFGDAYAINNKGMVVGGGERGSNGATAILWDAVFGTRDLQTLIGPSDWDLEVALAVNDVGQIAGYGIYDGALRAYVAVPVPEPDSSVLSLVGAGLVGLLFVRRKHRSLYALKGLEKCCVKIISSLHWLPRSAALLEIRRFRFRQLASENCVVSSRLKNGDCSTERVSIHLSTSLERS